MKKKRDPLKQKLILSYNSFFEEIRHLILSARNNVVRNINSIQVITNYEIGKRIIEHEQKGIRRAKYGEEILNNLSNLLTQEFGNGFSITNLKLMRKFFLVYSDRIGQTVSDQFKNQLTTSNMLTLSWSHYIFLMGIKDPLERDFYEIEAKEQNWSIRELKRQFNSSLFERLALSRNKKEIKILSKKGQIIEKPNDLMKNPLVLDFLGLNESIKYSESELESAIIDKMEQFLLELGKGFLFESRQKRLTFEENHFYIDLVFYNRLLRSYVLIDLKLGELTHKDLGQMQIFMQKNTNFIYPQKRN